MHARMADALNTRQGRGRGIGRWPSRRPPHLLGNYRSAGLRTPELEPGGSGDIAFPDSRPVAADALAFDYRCGGSVGIAVSRGSPTSRNLSAARSLTGLEVNCSSRRPPGTLRSA